MRKRDPDDKRAYCVYLTDRGREMKPLIFKIKSNMNDILLQGFSNEEKSSFVYLIEKAAVNIASENENRRFSYEQE